jgi:hypothetical protein
VKFFNAAGVIRNQAAWGGGCNYDPDGNIHSIANG